MSNIHERIYKKLVKLIPDLNSIEEHACSKSAPYMDLYLDILYRDKDSIVIALAHNFRQNGDVIPDPDMQIRIYPAMEMAEALTYQDQYSYQEVYPEPGMVNMALKKQLNQFLHTWLRNCLQQGHKLKAT